MEGQMDLMQKHIAYAEPHIRPILDELRLKILQLNGRIIERATPAQRVVYLEDRIFAEIKVQRRRVLVRIFDTDTPDPHGMLHHIEHAAKNGWQHDKELRLDRPVMLVNAMPFIEASLHLSRTIGLKTHGRRRASNEPVTTSQTRRQSENMTNIVIPAARVRQGELILYTTALKVRDLVRPGFYKVETLDPQNGDDTGYQRLLNRARANPDHASRGAFLRAALAGTHRRSVLWEPFGANS
jgi:hypothetical protein